ncbi:hypothetical protein PSPO01_09822 [Paraphaeosphaeria sporulosa]
MGHSVEDEGGWEKNESEGANGPGIDNMIWRGGGWAEFRVRGVRRCGSEPDLTVLTSRLEQRRQTTDRERMRGSKASKEDAPDAHMCATSWGSRPLWTSAAAHKDPADRIHTARVTPTVCILTELASTRKPVAPSTAGRASATCPALHDGTAIYSSPICAGLEFLLGKDFLQGSCSCLRLVRRWWRETRLQPAAGCSPEARTTLKPNRRLGLAPYLAQQPCTTALFAYSSVDAALSCSLHPTAGKEHASRLATYPTHMHTHTRTTPTMTF